MSRWTPTLSSRVLISETAQVDLYSIRISTEERWGVGQSVQYRDRLFAAFERLLAYPELGQAVSTSVGELRIFVVKHHRIAYEIVEDGIIIRRVLHERVDVETSILG